MLTNRRGMAMLEGKS